MTTKGAFNIRTISIESRYNARIKQLQRRYGRLEIAAYGYGEKIRNIRRMNRSKIPPRREDGEEKLQSNFAAYHIN